MRMTRTLHGTILALAAVALALAPLRATAGTKVFRCSTVNNNYGIGTSMQIPTGSTNFTIECWVKLDEVSIGTGNNYQYIMFGQFTSGAGRMLVGYREGCFGIFNGGGSDWVKSDMQPESNTWYHVAFVVDGEAANKTSVYVNGTLDKTSTASVKGLVQQYFTIGSAYYARQSDALSNIFKPFKGRIAEVRVWGVSRTAQQIADNYQTRLVGDEAGLLAYWPMDEDLDNGQTIVDVKNKVRSVVVPPLSIVEDDELDACLAPAASRVPSVTRLSFTGRGLTAHGNDTHGNANCVRGFETDITASLGKNFTIETWARPHTATSGEFWLLNQFKSGNGRFVFATTGNKPSFFVGDSTSGHVIAPEGLPVGEWTHLALTRNGDAFTLYTNGYVTLEQTVSGAYAPPATAFCIGSSSGVKPWNYYEGVGYTFGGSMREVRVWNSCRTAAQIRETMGHTLSGNESGLLGYWPLDEGSGSNVLNHVTGVWAKPVAGNPIWSAVSLPPVEQVPGPNTTDVAASFTGDNHSGADTGMKIQDVITSDYTIEAWLRIRGWEHAYFTGLNYAYVACQHSGGPSSRNMMFGVRGGHLFHLQDGLANTWLDGTIPLTYNRWTHVAFVQAGTKRRLYVDGVLDTEVEDGDASLPNASVNLLLGSVIHQIGHDRRWGTEGSLADVRLWNCARTTEEIARYRTHRLTGKEQGLVGYWPLDEGTGRILVNHKKNGTNGTLLATWDTLDDLYFDEPIIPGCTIIFR